MKTFVVARFVGRTVASRTITALLQNLILHISRLLSIQTRDIEYLDDVGALALIFQRVCCEVPKHSKLVVFVDGVDELVDAKGALSHVWIPSRLKENVKIIVSFAADAKATQPLLAFTNVLHISPMDVLTIDEMLHKWLKSDNRTLTKAQWKHVRKALGKKSHSPLYVQLLYEQVKSLHSFETELPVLFGDSEACIKKRFEALEMTHGRCFVTHAVLFIIVTKYGVSDVELEDFFSLDEEVKDIQFTPKIRLSSASVPFLL